MISAEVEFSDGRTATITGESREDIAAAVEQIESGMSATNKPEGNPVVGALESALTIGTSMVAEPVAGLMAIGGRVANLAMQLPQNDAEIVNSVQQGMTYEPRTETGQNYVGGIASALEPIGNALERVGTGLGDTAYESTGSPAAGAAAKSLPTAVGAAFGLRGTRAIANRADSLPTNASKVEPTISPKKTEQIEAIRRGETQTAGRRVDENGNIRLDRVEAEALWQGVRDGVVTMTRTASKADRANMRTMVDMLESGLKSDRYARANPPARIVGDSIAQRIRFVADKNKEAGQQLESVAKTLKGKQVDYRPAVDEFLSDLDDMGITYDGKNISFRNSDVQGLGGLERVVTAVIERMANVDNVDAYSVHQLKRFIDQTKNYGKKQEGLGGAVEKSISDLRRNLDAALDSTFDEYNRVNTVFSETKQVLDEFQNAVSKKINFDGPNLDKALGIESRKLISNYASGVPQDDALENLTSVANRYGAQFSDNLGDQVSFYTELTRLFPQSHLNTLQGNIERGVANAAKQGPISAVREAAADKAASVILRRNQENQIKALRKLLAEKPQSTGLPVPVQQPPQQ